MKKLIDLPEEKESKKRSKTSLSKPWKAVSMTRIRRMDVADVAAVDAVSGYLVDEEGNPLDAPEPWQPVYLRGLSKKCHPKWNVATAEASVVINRTDGWEVILSSGQRLIIRNLDRTVS